MPRKKRWSPVSHDFNRDPEIIEMRKLYGDWTALAWQEMIHEGDRNEGIVRGTVDQISLRLAPISLKNYLKPAQKTVQNVLRFAEERGWIHVGLYQIQILKHWKYHTFREDRRHPNDAVPIPPHSPPHPDPFPKKEDKKESSTANGHEDPERPGPWGKKL